MTPRVAQNVLNFMLSDRLHITGEDILPVAEIVRELQADINNGQKENTENGATPGTS
jgi:hypothetical protein